jgi:hypothetical protein
MSTRRDLRTGDTRLYVSGAVVLDKIFLDESSGSLRDCAVRGESASQVPEKRIKV